MRSADGNELVFLSIIEVDESGRVCNTTSFDEDAIVGLSARASGAFDVTCNVLSTTASPSGCTATFRFTGAFTGDRSWTATFHASFAGPGCGTAGGLCRTQTFTSVTGSR